MAVQPAGAPRVVGRYAIYDRIASGGMATVHLGRLLGPVGFARTVAIKRLHPQFAQDPQFVSMFLDEARLAARVSHPNVVQTLDVVAAEDELFLVMEYVQGEALQRLIRVSTTRREHVHPSMAATIIAGMLHGLHAAHEARDERGELLGIVHRDVSPQNVMVGVDGVARVLDFGVAKAAGRLQETRTGQLKGKLAYMAPEQIGGNVGRASDIYAASVVLWETLTGRRLFGGESDAEVMKKVLDGCSTPPSQFAPDIPPALDELTMRGLAREPSVRPATAGEMALALEDCIAQVPASRVGQWVQRCAADTLVERNQRVAAIETDSALRLMVPSGATPAAPEEAMQTQMSSGTGSAAAPAHVPANRRWPAWVAAACMLGVVGMAAVAARGVRRGQGPAVEASPPAAPAAVLQPVTEPTASVASAAASAATTASAQASATAAASASVAAPAAASATPQSRAHGTAHPAAASSAAKGQCDPPYYFDQQGNHHFKPECL